ncbi:LACT-domain-containing protein [Lactarius akahatsu]|uniref:LACT-domain-containing protein n=1 Tax=Lactarius akahatsu TaxID=416441 RepID=A0AAD4QFZ0_9AGAM|nr:LACT-domain-containing protein [Lactarius akahatsu]
MFHRNHRNQKAKTLPSARTEHDGQSEADTQSQTSDGASSSVSGAYEEVARNWRIFYSKNGFWFPFGIILGIALGIVFVGPYTLPDIPGHFSVFLEDYDISLPLPLLPIDLSRVQAEWQRLISTIPEPWKLNADGREFRVGDAIKARGLEANYPVILIPGVISTSLESWSTSPEYRAFFRQKVWGGFQMLSQVTFNREKWMSSLLLDPVTGLDPEGVKVRASEGFDAASSFIQGYWIWSKVIENLAVVNYDTNNLVLAPYDWRLTPYNLEERDGYFSVLKTTIEGFKKKQRRKCVIAAHSMGSTVRESPLHGQGGPDWVENHIQAIVSVAGTHLGVAKATAALLSGEMKDTVDLNPAGAYVLERFFSRKERQLLFRSWAGGASLWVKGGNAVWGNATHAPDDGEGGHHTYGELISFRRIDPMPPGGEDVDTPPLMQERGQTAGTTTSEGPRHSKFPLSKNLTADEAGPWILRHTPWTFRRMIAANYSYGIERDEEALKRSDIDHTKWTNPLESRLPNAPSLQIYCVYGHGKETEVSTCLANREAHAQANKRRDPTGERAYGVSRNVWAIMNMGANRYNSEPHESDYGSTSADVEAYPRDATFSEQNTSLPQDMAFARSWIDKDYTSESSNPKIRNGVKMGEGDGTVSLLSLGAMCVEGWKRKRWNPAGIKITTVELPHRPEITLPRGGANTSDHVDVLGSQALNEIILKVATGAGGEIRDNYVSRIREYAKKIRWDA